MNQDDFERYCRKSGDDGVYATNLVDNEHGFCSFRTDRNVLYIINTYGDGKYWDEYLTKVAKENGCTKMRFHTRRNPEAFARKYGAKLVGYVMEREV